MKRVADTQSIEISRALETWYARHHGAELRQSLLTRLQPLLDLAFGYHVLQLSPLQSSLIDGSPINHKIFASGCVNGEVSLCCHGDELPLESDSVDMVVAWHALEFDAHPHGSLREMMRVLRPRGHLVIVGFNPFSLLGLSQRLRRFGSSELWRRHHPVGLHRLTDWLHLVDGELESIQHLYPLPLSGQGRLWRISAGADRFFARHQLPGGGVYMAHALKQIPGARRPRPVTAQAPARFAGLRVARSPTPTRRQDAQPARRAAPERGDQAA